MKTLLLILAIAAPQIGQTTEANCLPVVTQAVNAKLIENQMPEVVEEIKGLPSPFFSELVLYSVRSGSASDLGIPYSSMWVVVARQGWQTACTVESVVLDLTAQ